MNPMSYFWLTVLVASLVAEASTAALIAVWFAPAALISFILASLNMHVIIQFTVFILLSAFCLAFFSMKLRNNILKTGTKTNIDALIGADAVAEEDFTKGKSGRVKIMGQSWTALTEAERTIVKGETVKVLKIEGVKLLCEPYIKGSEPEEQYIGSQARVEAEIDNFAGTGRVLIEGKSFLAKSADNGIIPKGTIIRIESISGGKYICTKL